MKKFETVEDLAKAASTLAGGFTKNAAFHKDAAGHHAGMSTHHAEMSAFHKGLHDALDDGHEHKALHKRLHEHHEAKKAHHDTMSKLHKAYGEDAEKAQKAFADAFGLEGTEPVAKTTPAASTPSGVVDSLVSNMAGDLNALAKDMIANDAAVKEMVRKTIADAIASALGNKIVPDGVKINATTDVPPGVRPVFRAGVQIEKADVDPEMEEALAL